ncbi:hypothetical protein PENTCL1PPCAC_19481, partial [Pristionchus entomophagus]
MFPDGCICFTSQCRWPPNLKAEKLENGRELKPVKEEEEEGREDGRERRDRKRRRDAVEDDQMMLVDDDFDGIPMRDEDDNDGNESDRNLVGSPPSRSLRRRRSVGLDESKDKNESRRSKKEECGDEEEKE